MGLRFFQNQKGREMGMKGGLSVVRDQWTVGPGVKASTMLREGGMCLSINVTLPYSTQSEVWLLLPNIVKIAQSNKDGDSLEWSNKLYPSTVLFFHFQICCSNHHLHVT